MQKEIKESFQLSTAWCTLKPTFRKNYEREAQQDAESLHAIKSIGCSCHDKVNNGTKVEDETAIEG